MKENKKAQNTIVVSDLHLSTCEPSNPKRPLWKKFRQRDFFFDELFLKFLHKLCKTIENEIELVFNGDTFDFDSVTNIPQSPRFRINPIERLRGLNSSEPKSVYKIIKILNDHPVFIGALADFLRKGHRVVFIVGNHDLELHWHSVREIIFERLGIKKTAQSKLIFANWFYLSNGDTLIEHGQQYDSYSMNPNPLNPFIKVRSDVRVKIAFGNLAHRFMMNGMGYFNPHLDHLYIMSFWEYIRVFFKFMIFKQPFLIYTWFFGAMATLFFSFRDGFLPTLADPLTISERVSKIARKANVNPGLVYKMREHHAHPIIMHPLKLLRELWLDRAFVFFIIAFLLIQITGFLKIINISLFFMIPVILAMAGLFFYYLQIGSKRIIPPSSTIGNRYIKLAAKIISVKRVVLGHTHIPKHKLIGDVEYLNSGFWSGAFYDIECKKPARNKTFVWIRGKRRGRLASLHFLDDFLKS